ncbi:oligogalacturonate lyase family protein [Falsirhodobacter deserti]|uniref:oligogalacturonate lyase family protein n=1 Tax=Falsirhodobacter deserti TaxID=1365611 RepID=UPI000FE3B2C7|nr:oligogalacturonate lyase family protein [Falsirhodobacter deserti]
MNKRQFMGLGLATGIGAMAAPGLLRQASAATDGIPTDWRDGETGYRIVRLSRQDDSRSLYFHDNAFTADGRWMVFERHDGLSLIDFTTMKPQPLIEGQFKVLMVSRTKPVLYAERLKGEGVEGGRDYVSITIPDGSVTDIATNVDGRIYSVNADDTLLLGTWAERHYELQPGPKVANTDGGYNAVGPDGKPLTFQAAKEVRLAERLNQRIPMEIFTLNMQGQDRQVITGSTDWLNHVQFSPADPKQIMYCHEGPWHGVDRIWIARTDGGEPQRVHQRMMNMEIAGHEFFSYDGKTIWYDLQTPRGEDFWLSSYDLASGKRIWRHMDRDAWSVHFQISRDGSLLAGDGGDETMVARAKNGKWLYLYDEEIIEDLGVSAPNANDLVRPAVLHPKRIADLRNHDYRVEPNIQFSPDNRWLVFRSNMHGPIHVYAVDLTSV